jgi:hypothetical protein
LPEPAHPDCSAHGPYSVKESDEFLASARVAAGSIARWDEVKYAGTWALERDPHRGNWVESRQMWALLLQFPPQGELVVFYTIDETTSTVIPRVIHRL